jgi:hypothetical protein
MNAETIPVLYNAANNDSNLSHHHELAIRAKDQCHDHVLSDTVLPKFFEQNILHYLADLDGYFRLKNVPEAVQLPLAVKAVTDSYSRQ